MALAIIYRVVFAHRLRVPGGRTRQPRLGLVDAFSLDGQRQLVLVRRDNVEHLVMIGGPNDVLLELQINRAAGDAARESDCASVPPPRRADVPVAPTGPGRSPGGGLPPQAVPAAAGRRPPTACGAPAVPPPAPPPAALSPSRSLRQRSRRRPRRPPQPRRRRPLRAASVAPPPPASGGRPSP